MKRKIMSNDYYTMMLEAVKAANEAGDKWMESHKQPIWNVMDGNRCVGQLLDVCGFGYVQIVDKRTGFAKYIKKIQNGYNGSVQINHKYRGRQEWSLNESTAYAALKVFTDAGVKGLTVYSRID